MPLFGIKISPLFRVNTATGATMQENYGFPVRIPHLLIIQAVCVADLQKAAVERLDLWIELAHLSTEQSLVKDESYPILHHLVTRVVIFMLIK